jgi:isopentenyldiphosphate isomerase
MSLEHQEKVWMEKENMFPVMWEGTVCLHPISTCCMLGPDTRATHPVLRELAKFLLQMILF